MGKPTKPDIDGCGISDIRKELAFTEGVEALDEAVHYWFTKTGWFAAVRFTLSRYERERRDCHPALSEESELKLRVLT